jgi:hypothetical protein
MKITREKLDKLYAHGDWLYWFEEKFPNGSELNNIIKQSLEEEYFDFANWIILKLGLSRINKIRYVSHIAELVLPIFEDEYPEDKRPRDTVEKIKIYLNTGQMPLYDSVESLNLYIIYSHCRRFCDNAGMSAAGAIYSAYVAITLSEHIYCGSAITGSPYVYASRALRYSKYILQNKEFKTKIINYGMELIENNGEKS